MDARDIDVRLSAIEQRLTALETKMEERFSYLESNMREMREYMNQMYEMVVEMGKRLSAAETNISNIKNTVRQTSSLSIDTLKLLLASLLSFVLGFLLNALFPLTPR